jgi:hypothetical protein
MGRVVEIREMAELPAEELTSITTLRVAERWRGGVDGRFGKGGRQTQRLILFCASSLLPFVRFLTKSSSRDLRSLISRKIHVSFTPISCRNRSNHGILVDTVSSDHLALDKGRKICYNMDVQGKSSSFNCIGSDKGKPIERWGRKATGLSQHVVIGEPVIRQSGSLIP